MDAAEREAMARALVDGNNYMTARAEQVTAADEIERGMSVFSQRWLEQRDRPWTPDEVGPSGRLRLYRATASEQFVLSPEDERLPVRLE